MFVLSEEKKKLLKTEGNLLVLGGPGSGKTTIALLKARDVIEGGNLKRGQKVLFLSFARATVTRIEEQVGQIINKSISSCLEVNTYHSFTWNILRSHGYLINSNVPIKLLTPPEAATKLANITGNKERNAEKLRLFEEEGILHFDLFAKYAGDLLGRSNSLASIISDSYPVVMLDEFQDTNSDEWELIKVIGKRSTLIALADAEQRIYEFRGADPARIGQYISHFSPKQFDFGIENNRSSDTDIVQFGNDLLTGMNTKKSYKNVHILYYPYRSGFGTHFDLKLAVWRIRKRLIELGKRDWSVAVLVPSKKLMLEVSEFLDSKQELPNNKTFPRIAHEVALETAGPSLAAVLIALLLDMGSQKQIKVSDVITYLCDHARGRKGDEPPSKVILTITDALIDYVSTRKIVGSKRKAVIKDCEEVAKKCNSLDFSGNPIEDWMLVRNILEESSSDLFKQLVSDSKYLRLMHKGSELRSNLSNLWRTHGSYLGGIQAVKSSLLQEHFSSSNKVWIGVNVLTIHKSKGKEFDEVIIYEGRFHGKIGNRQDDKKRLDQARLNFRVAVTRAKKNVTILTPENDICIFLKG
ncbi:UvrD-helicase domain-containing protein [Paenibacillus sp. 32O-W]|uniref:UvrD-helicase domain-containing protein n=1 Tax=Paenibacillus sp. 32O-W TaxID=1695218 RepID=UPI0011A93B04|nr:ATP-dependent helicase [Paenibacillus sp. 32O-W]